MAALNASLAFFFATFAVCEAARRAARSLLPASAWGSLAREAAGAAQLCACGLEMTLLLELGPWAGGFGPDLLLTLLFLLLLLHGATCAGAAAWPTVALRDFLLAEAPLPGTLLKPAAQALGAQAAGALTRLCWAWGLSELHTLQALLAADCSWALRSPGARGALREGTCAFLFHLALLGLRRRPVACRAPALALLVTVMTHTAGPSTSAFFSPALAAPHTLQCPGHTWLEHAQVYCLGPLTGMVLAVLLYQGNIPRLFQRNLLYSQKNKYRTPRGKPAPRPGDPQTPLRGRAAGSLGRAG
ncbi:aquaporin-12-like isoform X1 [Choloepus didactylus]|uniref:aquaporin-12-like isoform X1 n=1 Tax=Choloepus didactylus TaxID=27675 RepID=UPI00189F5AD1|nr:aquaporin-12-like isoform X1 [Choloepus didactylus]